MLALLAAAVVAQTHDLSFEPKDREPLVISLKQDTEWDYPDEDMKGKLRAELTLRWTFKDWTGTATFERILYQGKGRKKGADFDHDIEWNLKDGYLKGKDSDADKQWCAGERQEGLKLKFDRRGACEVGEC
jgi:hypothetical protein